MGWEQAKFNDTACRISDLVSRPMVFGLERIPSGIDESYFFPKALAILLYAAETEWPEPTGSRVRVKRG